MRGTAVPRAILLDCDTGIDDAMAILYLLGDPAVDLVAITTTFGNTTSAQAARNTLGVLTMAGRDDVPVSVGAARPLTRGYGGGAPHVHGSNGIGDIDLPEPSRAPTDEAAGDTIVRLAHEHAGALDILAIGPLTNIATALAAEPRLPQLIRHLTVMGGAALAPGNLSPVAEANIGNDPEAAAAVFASGATITLVPLDVTMNHVLEESGRQALLTAPTVTPRTIGRMLGVYFGFYTEIMGRSCCALHDPLAAAIATGGVIPSLAPTVRVSVDDSSGLGRGQTICDMRGRYRGYPTPTGANARVVLELPEPFAPHLISRLLAF
jgi:purine nucleosidase